MILMEQKDFSNAAEFFFDTNENNNTTTPTEEISEAKYNVREIISKNEEKLTKRVQLTIYPTAYEQAKLKAISEGRSFNNYVNELILKDLSK